MPTERIELRIGSEGKQRPDAFREKKHYSPPALLSREEGSYLAPSTILKLSIADMKHG